MDTSLLAEQIVSEVTVPNFLPLSPDVLRNKILGTLFGNALGDAVGLRTEFNSSSDSKLLWNSNDWTLKGWNLGRGFPEGDWTDDTDQMLLILKAYLETYTVDPKVFARNVLGWMHHGIKEFGDTCGMGIGFTVMNVLTTPNFLSDPFAAALKVWIKGECNLAPNGAIMRTSVLGIIDYNDLKKVIKHTIDIATVTHADPRCVAACIASTTAIALMLQGASLHEAYETSVSIAKAGIWKYAELLEKIINENGSERDMECFQAKKENFRVDLLERFLRIEFEDMLPIDGQDMGYTYYCVGCGFWALRQENWFESIKRIILEGGDADTNGAVAGSLIGCKLGFTALPESLVSELLFGKWLEEKANLLIDHLNS